jgi:hypothetical protein
MAVNSAPLKEWLRTKRTVNDLYQIMMSLRYDLDGATDAGQLGLAWRTQEELLRVGVELHLCQVGVQLPARQDDDRLDRGFRVMEALERMDPARAAEAWRLWLHPIPPPDLLTEQIHRTLSFLVDELGHAWLRSRRETVLAWASDTEVLRAAAKAFGVAQSDDWYLSATPGSSTEDWYQEVLDSLDEEHLA